MSGGRSSRHGPNPSAIRIYDADLSRRPGRGSHTRHLLRDISLRVNAIRGYPAQTPPTCDRLSRRPETWRQFPPLVMTAVRGLNRPSTESWTPKPRRPRTCCSSAATPEGRWEGPSIRRRRASAAAGTTWAGKLSSRARSASLRNPVGTGVSSGERPPGVLANEGFRESPAVQDGYGRIRVFRFSEIVLGIPFSQVYGYDGF